MKKLLFLFASIALFSCSKNDEDNSSLETTQLVGTWLLENAQLDGKNVSSSYKIQFTTTKKATYFYKNPTSNSTFGPDTIETGDYQLSDNSITITWTDSDPGLEKKTYQILELTSTKLKLKSTDAEGTLIENYKK